jgi:catechol 2,3-dioxygenase-like lactoylglutathione lyase family enzyme
MQQRLTYITLGVRDFDAMKTFYTKAFGWTPLKEPEGIVFFKLNGIILSLYPSGELASDAGVSAAGNGFKQFTLSINFNSPEEVDTAFQEVVKGGAKAIKQPEKAFWGGYSSYIADPEDNLWELAHNPYLETDAEGNVTGHQ